MCGILGWLGHIADSDVSRFDEALDTLSHRGPDDRGILQDPGLLLGHRRLSILDLSDAGHQPMVHEASGAAIIFNGEIYNHVELRAELESRGHRFKGHSDTEVLLCALAEWGHNALSRLNGMWAFGFWDPRRRQLLLSRDRFGVKPLYYCQGPEGLVFASEPKALLQLFPRYRTLSQETLLDFLANNRLYANGQSFYEGVRVFPPAHYAVYEPDRQTLRYARYWEYPSEVNTRLNAEEAVAQFDQLFGDAVRLRLRSDVPIGVTLSGGLDSTSVLDAAVRSSSKSLNCFTSVYSDKEIGELGWARLASEKTGSPLTPVCAPHEGWLPTLRKVAWHMDAPGYSPAVYPLWELMRRARCDGVPVLLEGQGADEALAGYPQYAVLELLSYIAGKQGEHRSIKGVMLRIQALQRAFSMRWAAAWALREMLPVTLRGHRRRVGFQSLLRTGVQLPDVPEPSLPRNGDSVWSRLLADHGCDILPGLLHYGDAISMAHSIETRHPFMDYRLVEWMFRLPTCYKLNQGETKWVLREFLRRRGHPVIGNRQDKKGYPTPVRNWLAADRGREVTKLLLDTNGPLHTWCAPARIRNLIRQNRRGVISAEHHLYKLVSTQIWLEECKLV